MKLLRKIAVQLRKTKQEQTDDFDLKPFWQQMPDPASPVVIIVRPREGTSCVVFDRCVEALRFRYNILFCARRTPWRYIRSIIRKAKISPKNIQGVLLNRRPARAMQFFCRRRKIPTVFLAEMDSISALGIRRIRCVDRIIYSSKDVFDLIAAQALWGYPVDLAILPPTQDLVRLADELSRIFVTECLTIGQRARDVEFLQSTKTIDLSYWNGRKWKLWLSRKDAVRYLREWRTGFWPKRPIPGFHPGIYAENHDLKLPNGVYADPFIHYLQAGCPQGKWSWPVLRENMTLTQPMHQKRIALHIHAFYIEMLPDMIKRLRVNTIRPDLYISVRDEVSLAQAQSCLASYEAACTIRMVPNRGRDIGPLLTEFGRELVANYDIIGHLHTKKSLQESDRVGVERWVNFLSDNLLGDGKSLFSADMIIQKMCEDLDINLVFPDDKNAVGWGITRNVAQKIAPKLGLVNLPEFFNFPVGTMFWSSAALLRPFVELGFEWEDYPPEPIPFPFDGTNLHAIERFFGIVAQEMLGKIVTTLFGKARR